MASFTLPAEVGDGHPVLVVPGFTADDDMTVMFRLFLQRSGFEAHAWELGRNLGWASPGLLAEQVAKIVRRSERKVSLVGWSLGGVMAHDVAASHPHLVRQVIALGSPLGKTHSPRGLPVPFTSIYSKSDGIVNWRESVLPSNGRTENIEVQSSHWGLVNNPDVKAIVADRLAQPEGCWSPFDAKAA